MIRKAIIIAALLATVAAWADMEWQTAIGQKDQCTSGLVAYWAMRNSGTTVYDEWTGGYNGTASNGVTFGETYAAVGQGASFDGSDDVISISDSAALSVSGAFTLSAWIYPTAINDFAIFSKFNDVTADTRSVSLSLRNTGKIQGYVSHDGSTTGADNLLTPTTIASNTWSHIVYVWKTGQKEIWINGTMSTNAAVVNNTVYDNANPLHIGRSRQAGVWYFAAKGRIDEARVYNIGLTADEIKQLYRMGAIPKGIK
jgi:hypothetical protein